MFDDLYKAAVSNYTKFLMEQEREAREFQNQYQDNLYQFVKAHIKENLRDLEYSIDDCIKHTVYIQHDDKIEVYLWLPKIFPIKFRLKVIDGLHFQLDNNGFWVVDLLDSLNGRMEFDSNYDGHWQKYIDTAIGCSVDLARRSIMPDVLLGDVIRKTITSLPNLSHVG